MTILVVRFGQDLSWADKLGQTEQYPLNLFTWITSLFHLNCFTLMISFEPLHMYYLNHLDSLNYLDYFTEVRKLSLHNLNSLR